MLIKERKHFRNARRKCHCGTGIFSDIFGKVTQAVGSQTAKTIGSKAVEGLAKGVQQGAEHGAKELIKTGVNKLTKPKQVTLIDSNSVPSLTSTMNTMSPTSTDTDAKVRNLMSLLKKGSGIKTII